MTSPQPAHDHDDRDRSQPWKSNNRRRGRGHRGGGRARSNYSHKGRGRGGSNYGGQSQFDNDGDTPMGRMSEGGGSSQPRYNPYSSNRDSNWRGKRGNSKMRMDIQHTGNRWQSGNRYGKQGSNRSYGGNQWYTVRIPQGKKFSKDEIFGLITSNIDFPFNPVNFHYENAMAMFHVQDRQVVESLKKMNNKITFSNGYKMLFVVRPGPPPILPFSEEIIEKLKVCMSGRYNPATLMLDLSNLYQDPAFQQEQVSMAVNRGVVMTSIINIIKEHIPELKGINMSQNRLNTLDYFKHLVQVVPKLQALNLGKNQLKSMEEITKISNWNLSELILDGNPVCDSFRDQADYISAVRKKFPKVLKLDGHDLPPPITFDIETASILPPSKESYFLKDDMKALIVKFLKQYYDIYDSDNRQPLMAAYHDKAVFSYSTGFNREIIGTLQANLRDYLNESRNLLKLRGNDNQKRTKLLKQGGVNIISQLCLMPKTTHDLTSFVVDVNLMLPTMLSFTLTGVFKETDSHSDNPPIRAFNRMFVTVPLGQGIVITNDVLTITNATMEMARSAFKNPAPTPSSSPVPGVSTQNLTSPSTSDALSPEQRQMAQEFAVQSGMNIKWSQKCLEQNAWNYEKSGQVFIDLKRQDKIPPEAFGNW